MNGDDLPGIDDVVEMAETMALFRSGFDALTRHAAIHGLSNVDPTAEHVAQDQEFTIEWRRASPRARAEALTTIASVTASTGATLDDAAPPDSPARVLLAYAHQISGTPRADPSSSPFGPVTGADAAYAARLVRVVFAVLGLHAMATTMHDPPRGEDAA
jgi:hypothetical protein